MMQPSPGGGFGVNNTTLWVSWDLQSAVNIEHSCATRGEPPFFHLGEGYGASVGSIKSCSSFCCPPISRFAAARAGQHCLSNDCECHSGRGDTGMCSCSGQTQPKGSLEQLLTPATSVTSARPRARRDKRRGQMTQAQLFINQSLYYLP